MEEPRQDIVTVLGRQDLRELDDARHAKPRVAQGVDDVRESLDEHDAQERRRSDPLLRGRQGEDGSAVRDVCGREERPGNRGVREGEPAELVHEQVAAAVELADGEPDRRRRRDGRLLQREHVTERCLEIHHAPIP